MNDNLFTDNTSVLNVLPAVRGLFHYESKYASLMRCMENHELEESDPKLFHLIESKLTSLEPAIFPETELAVDEQKALLLSMAFGSEYLRAVQILSNSSILLKVLTWNATEEPTQFAKLFAEKLTLSQPFRILVRDYEENHYGELEELQFKSLIEEVLGSSIESSTSSDVSLKELENKMKNSLFEEYLIDLDNWYCTCTSYQMCYQSSFLDTEVQGYQHINLQGCEENVVSQLISRCKSKILSPIPICRHLISVIILLENYMQLEEKLNVVVERDSKEFFKGS